ncbi:MAG: lysophospholipid acyltransferase family protein [Deltaproteobacteria bacterium]|nr:lysophospholipid acyltransferase family protein [Deltaproteobacteria bacterium]
MKPNHWLRPALWAILALSWTLSLLPRALALALGDLGGLLFHALGRRRREIARDNIQKAKDNGALDQDLDVAATARKSFENLGRTAIESFCLLHRGLGYFEGRVEMAGAAGGIPALVEEAGKTGRGVIFLTAHAGNWELSTAAVPARFGFKVSVVGRSQGRLSNEILGRIRSKGGGQFIFKDGGAVAMLRLLRSGGFLGTLFDQADIVGTGAAKLTFMGRPALTTLGPLRLAAKTGAPVVPFFCRRQGDRHVIEFSPHLTPPPGNDRDWLLDSAQKLNDLLAGFIRLHPDQWMWSHRRWKMPDNHEEGHGSP